MKRLLTTAAMFLCCMATMFAQFNGLESNIMIDPSVHLTELTEPVSEQQALEKAQHFMKSKKLKGNLKMYRAHAKNTSQEKEPFYVFNAEDNKGFVIVSGDNRTEEILGYSDNGNFDINNMPENMRSWINGISKEIEMLDKKPFFKAPRSKRSAISPLIQTKWSQGAPYNLQCPEFNGQHFETGCTATAMAQVMYYYKWPKEETAELLGYTGSCSGIEYPTLPPTTFDWGKMKLEYSNINETPNYTNEEGEAVAKLMRCCGQAVKMDYGTFGSVNRVYAEYLIYKFGYSPNAKTIRRKEYPTSEWEEVIYNEVNNGRPVLYMATGLQSQGHGQYFVCDGFDGNGLFHINWGWGGYLDGFFALSILDYHYEGEVAGYSTDGFSMDHTAIIGIEPNYDVDFKEIIYFTGYGFRSAGRKSIDQDFWLSMYNLEANYAYNHSAFHGKYGLAVLKDGVLQEVLLPGEYDGPYPNVEENSSVFFGANWTDNRTLKLYYRIDETDEWKDAHFLSYDYTPEDKTCGFKLNVYACILFWGGFPGEPEVDMKINSITFDGPILSGEKNYATINLTNTGESYEQPMYIGINDEMISYCSAWLSPQETGNVRISLTPKSPGKKEIKITSIPTTHIYEDGTREDRTRTYYSNVLTILDGAASSTLLSCDDLDCIPGSTSILKVQLDNENEVKLCQFDLKLPNGVTVAKMDNGKLDAKLTNRAESHSISSQQLSNGNYRFIISSMDNDSFTGNSGTLVEITLDIPATMDAGEYTVKLLNAGLSVPDGNDLKVVKPADTESKLTIKTYTPDDPNPGGGEGGEDETPDTDISSMSNVIYLNKVEASGDSQINVSIRMKNSTAIRGFQFDLYLPEGVTVVKSAKGKIVGSLSEGRLPEDDEHTLTLSEQSDGSIRFLCGSLYDETFTGTDGEIATLAVKIAANMEDGNYALILRNIKLTETDINNYYETDYVKSTLTISSYTLGDINNDKQVDVSDYIGIANHILGSTPEGFNMKAADVNEDGNIDVSDYIGVANIILTGSVYGSSNAPMIYYVKKKEAQEVEPE